MLGSYQKTRRSQTESPPHTARLSGRTTLTTSRASRHRTLHESAVARLSRPVVRADTAHCTNQRSHDQSCKQTPHTARLSGRTTLRLTTSRASRHRTLHDSAVARICVSRPVVRADSAHCTTQPSHESASHDQSCEQTPHTARLSSRTTLRLTTSRASRHRTLHEQTAEHRDWRMLRLLLCSERIKLKMQYKIQV